LAVAGLYHWWPVSLALSGVDSRLAYTLQANAFAALPLLIGIVTVSNNRFLSAAIDPLKQQENVATRINARVIENTLQQYVLLLIATLALSVNLTSAQMRIIPAAIIVFIVARMAFWIGYRIHPLYRAFG